MKHVQKMLVPEHLLQSLETEHRLTSPPQLTTLSRLDQDMKHITDSTLPADQKVALLDQLLQRYQGLVKQMKSETNAKHAGTAKTTPNAPSPNHSPTISEVQPKKTEQSYTRWSIQNSCQDRNTTFSYRTGNRSLDL